MSCEAPCYQQDVSCVLDIALEMRTSLPPETDYRVLVEDAFGQKKIVDAMTDEVGSLLIDSASVSSWVDRGAQLTFTILELDTNDVVPIPLGTGDFNCALITFTDGGYTYIG